MNVRIFAFALCVAATGAANAADTVIARFTPALDASLNYGSFGYTDELGEYHVLTDNRIVSTHVVVDFTPGPGVKTDHLFVGMVVPTDSPNQFIAVEGSALTHVGDGNYHYELTTDDYNGIIRSGRFSVDSYGVDPITGEPASLMGSSFGPDTGFYFTVLLPEPATLSALAGASMFLRRRRR